MSVCSVCEKDPSSHSFKKVGEKRNISMYYSKPSMATKYDDKEGILQHIDNTLKLNKNKYICIIDGDGFDIKYTLEVQLGLGILDLIMNKYGDQLIEVKVINPSVYINGIIKVMQTIVDASFMEKITVLDDRKYSILQFI